jgi:NhaA family Na+:H+ antiporter
MGNSHGNRHRLRPRRARAAGAHFPRSVLTFPRALAIVDDLGALVVIALFYMKALDGPLLLMALVWIGVQVLFNLVVVRRPWPYFVLELLLWATLLKSGVHATLAGVATAFGIGAPSPERFSRAETRGNGFL